MEKVYKVVYGIDLGTRLLRSATATGKALVFYELGEWVEAPEWLAKQGYHILVFNDHISAMRTYNGSADNFPIFECEAEGEVTLPPACDLSALHSGILKAFKYTPWPDGTRMFKRVKLVRRLKV